MSRQLLDLLDAAWMRWLIALDKVEPGRVDERLLDDNWSVKDLIAHNLFWDAEVLTDIQRWRSGLAPVINDWQAMNDANHAVHKDRDAILLRVEMHLVHETVRAAIAGLPDSLPAEMIERIAVDTWEHYDDHAGQVETWLTG